MARPKPTKMLALLGRCRRTGRWRVAQRSQVLAVLGTCNLDMRRSFVDSGDQLKMKVTVVFGSATFLLPEGAEVRPSGVSLLASSLVDVPEHDSECDLPMVEIEWICMFGRLRIVTERSLAQSGAEPGPGPDVVTELEPAVAGADEAVPDDTAAPRLEPVAADAA